MASENHSTCKKVEHVGSGYLHGEDDDRPYDVDGVMYCGRCHIAMPSEPSREAIEAAIGAVKPTDRVLSWELMRDRLIAAYDIDFSSILADRDAWQKQAEIQEESLRRAQSVVEELLPIRAELQAAYKEAEDTLAFYAEKGRVTIQRDGTPIQRLAGSAEIAIVKLEDELQAAREDMQEAATAIEGFGVRLSEALTENNSLREEIERLHQTIGEYERDQMLMDEIATERDTAQAEIERLKAENKELDEQIDRWESGTQYRPV